MVKKYASRAQVEAWWVKKARESPKHFMWYVTGLKPALHHDIWIANFFHPYRRFVNIIGPRFSAKSHISVLASLWNMSKNPYSTNCIISVSSDQAERRISMLKTFVRENVRYRNVFPWIHVDDRMPNTNKEFTLYSDYKAMSYRQWKSSITTTGSHLDKNPSIKALGAGGKGLIGSRFSGAVLLDDIVDKEDLSEPAQTKKLNYIKRDIIPCMTEEARLWNIGTRWMIGDIYESLEKNPMFHTITIPAIIKDSDGVEYSYWEEEWSLERLENERLIMDDDVLFRVMFMCDPTATIASLFTYDDLARDLPERLPEFTQVYVTTDFAISGRETADWNVLYFVGIDRDKNVYIMDGMRFREEPGQTVQNVIAFASMARAIGERLDGVLIEHVGFQTLFQSMIRQIDPHLPVFPVRPSGDKMMRAKRVSYHAKQRRLFINQRIPFIDQLKTEWFNFDKYKYDDTLDPMSLLFQHVGYHDISARIIRVRNPLIL